MASEIIIISLILDDEVVGWEVLKGSGIEDCFADCGDQSQHFKTLKTIYYWRSMLTSIKFSIKLLVDSGSHLLQLFMFNSSFGVVNFSWKLSGFSATPEGLVVNPPVPIAWC
ncbi:hypothetical protein [Prochlorococcus sp. MIT 1201]|uniref:hypothetical protein n=1 Tax=Prochlorococcus sp. MIT 1201 TaxID=3082535 RepID=UPI0039A72DF4